MGAEQSRNRKKLQQILYTGDTAKLQRFWNSTCRDRPKIQWKVLMCCVVWGNANSMSELLVYPEVRDAIKTVSINGESLLDLALLQAVGDADIEMIKVALLHGCQTVQTSSLWRALDMDVNQDTQVLKLAKVICQCSNYVPIRTKVAKLLLLEQGRISLDYYVTNDIDVLGLTCANYHVFSRVTNCAQISQMVRRHLRILAVCANKTTALKRLLTFLVERYSLEKVCRNPNVDTFTMGYQAQVVLLLKAGLKFQQQSFTASIVKDREHTSINVLISVEKQTRQEISTLKEHARFCIREHLNCNVFDSSMTSLGLPDSLKKYILLYDLV